ncbi:hypothetical protein IU433_12195 [Nocardia puris]|uniref:hypothetical protein n=1 Tax=Nocardia puris TaxID=208602 RepID=UPI0018955812|nr:hypothetical protein [Nocardia puris]MBF6459797.1 hypothetical protein [Nocardia puris]
MDVSFPAHISVERDVEVTGLPVLTATVTPAPEAEDLPLPAGPKGPPGAVGEPRAPFRKAGEIPNALARPAGLGADDRGRWWHRRDDDSMDVWTGAEWVNSPGAVGAQGPTAPPTVLNVATTHDAALTVPALQITPDGATLQVAFTAPAGVQGEQGPAGASGAISTSPDYDTSVGPAQRGVFALNLGARRWKAQPAPNGHGLWSWWDTNFNADAQAVADQIVALTVTIPALPYQWRPMAWGALYIYCQPGYQSDAEVRVRIGSQNGVMVASGAGIRADGSYILTSFNPTFGDEATKPLSPSSTYATIPAYTETNLVVAVERVGVNANGGQIGFQQGRASLTLWAQPV